MKVSLILLSAILVASFVSSEPASKFLKKDDTSKTIHIVPHTHDDAGWNWTYKDYYYGSASMNLGVKDIFNSMVDNLSASKERTFIEVEIAFFEKWWIDQTETTKNKVREFVKEGRLEFINGGYVMHDEAASYYQHFIDQTRLGLMFIKREFNVIPRIAWFIDPFGHSAANAAILSKMGYEKIAFVRIDYKEKEQRQKNKTLEFKWKPFSQLSSFANTEIFTHITYAHYCLPGSIDGFDNDDLKVLSDDEWNRKADDFYNELNQWQSGFATSNVMLMYGCDFTHRVRYNNYLNIEKLMSVMKIRHPDMKLVYSTPTKYFDAVLAEYNQWSVYENQDFFPYADNDFSYWTGYFSSRPYLKGMVREAGNYLANSSKFLLEYILAKKHHPRSHPDMIDFNVIKSLELQHEMRKSLAICQHHDAVSGTAKELVSQDYISMLNDGIDKTKQVFKNTIKELVRMDKREFNQVCINPITNFYCDKIFSDMNQDRKQKYLVYKNSNEKGLVELSFRVKGPNYKVLDSNGKELTSDIVCEDIEHSQQLCQIFFNIDFEENMYVFTIQEVDESRELKAISLDHTNSNALYDDNFIKISNVANDDGLEIEVKENATTGAKDQKYTIKLNHATYTSYDGNNSDLRPQGSNNDGAYILSTTKLQPDFKNIDFSKSKVFKGETIFQLSFQFPESRMNIRYNPVLEYVFEVESVFNPHYHPDGDQEGKELLLHLRSDLNNNIKINDQFTTQEFWTDANGTKMMRRFKDYRTGFKYTVTEPVASNFYPVNFSISIREKAVKDYTPNDYDNFSDSDRMLSFFNDRSQSGGAMETGSIMLLLNRYSKKDDSRGVDQPIYEENSLPYQYRVLNWFAVSNFYDRNKVEDYIHQRPSIITIADHAKLEGIKSFTSSIIEADHCMTMDYFILDPRRILVQAYNKEDPYHHKNSQCKLTFNPSQRVHYSLTEMNLNGVEKAKNATELSHLEKSFKPHSQQDKQEFNIDMQDFKAFLLELR